MARNTMYMYIRMVIVLLIGLYSSRVLLSTLGVEDYGTYNLVGSVVSMVSMLQTLFMASTKRFITYELGKKNFEGLNVIFNMSILINIVVSLIFVVFVEILGWWFFTYEINIAPLKLASAKWVFQISVISAVIMIMTSPFDALVIAHEHMGFYALTAILNSALKLIIIFLVPLFNNDNLVVYALLLLSVSCTVRFINSVYCKTKFPECRYKFCWDKSIFEKMLSFSGWSLLGGTASALTQNGLNLIFNIFGGTAVNAARGIAYQVDAVVRNFFNNVTIVVAPYGIKSYASGNKEGMFNMFYFSSKILFVSCFCIIIPICYETSLILNLWLTEVPEYTVGFVQLVLIWSICNTIHGPINTLYSAVGDIKQYKIIEFVIHLMPLLSSYILLNKGFSLYLAFASGICFEIIDISVILLLARKVIGLNLKQYIKEMLPLLFVSFLLAGIGYFISNEMFGNHYISFLLGIIVDVMILLFMFLIAFSERERNYIKSLLKTKLNR